jgi:hypothetical protein
MLSVRLSVPPNNFLNKVDFMKFSIEVDLDTVLLKYLASTVPKWQILGWLQNLHQ